MVKATTIRQYNDSDKERDVELVCVFAGATSGIGASTLEKMVQTLQKSTFYVLGRSAPRCANHRAKLESLNPSCKLVFIQAEVSLLSDIYAACKQINAFEQKVDYLYMSPDTKGGLENCFSIPYYARIRLVCNLMPLLRQSPRPRVLNVLNGGREKALREQDIRLEQLWSPIAVVNHTTTMTSFAFEHLAEENKRFTFLHSYPGLVRTDIFARLTPPESGIVWRVTLAAIRGMVAVVMLCVGMEPEECGERQNFLLTTDRYGPGAWRINSSSEQVFAPGVLERYREGSWSERIWDHTMRVSDTVLAIENDSVPR